MTRSDCQLGAMSRPAYWLLEAYAYRGWRAALGMMVDELEPVSVGCDPGRADDKRRQERAS